MMTFCLCQRADAIGEGQCLGKIAPGEAVLQAFDPIPLDDLPAGHLG